MIHSNPFRERDIAKVRANTFRESVMLRDSPGTTIFVLKSIHRSYEWKNEDNLYRSGLKVCPKNSKIHVFKKLGNSWGHVWFLPFCKKKTNSSFQITLQTNGQLTQFCRRANKLDTFHLRASRLVCSPKVHQVSQFKGL